MLPSRLTSIPVNGAWRIDRSLGSGAFGEVYKVTCIKRSECDGFSDAVAKISKSSNRNFTVDKEYRIMKRLEELQLHTGMGKCIFYGTHGDRAVLIMKRLGKDLYTISRDYTLSMKSVLMIGIQMIKRLRAFHEIGFVHADVKPDNILYGREDPDRIYLVDFGLACRYKRDGMHVTEGLPGNSIVGTYDFASLNVLEGYRPSRRDDIISLAYTLSYLLRRRLPWHNLHKSDPYFEEKIKIMKRNTSVRSIAGGCSAIRDMLYYALDLSFEEKPDYANLIRLFEANLDRIDKKDDRIFEWM